MSTKKLDTIRLILSDYGELAKQRENCITALELQTSDILLWENAVRALKLVGSSQDSLHASLRALEQEVRRLSKRA